MVRAVSGAVMRWRGRGHHLRIRTGGGCLLGAGALLLFLAFGFAYLSERGRPLAPVKDSASATLVEACREEPGRFPGSARYQGPAPHPLVLYVHADQAPSTEKKVLPFAGERWQDTSYAAYDRHRVQLVACAERGYEERMPQTCQYDQGTAPLFSVIYRIRLVEAHTGRRLATVTARPSVIECPPRPVVDVTRPRAYAPLRPEDVTRVLDPYTTRWVP